MDFVGWKILLQLTNELPKAPFTLSYRRGERTIELAVKQEFPVLGIEAHDIGGQHIDGEIRREPRNVFAVILCKLDPGIACHEVSTAPCRSSERQCKAYSPPALRRQARPPAFLDRFATGSVALRTPDARITWEAPQTRSLAGSNLIKSRQDGLRLST